MTKDKNSNDQSNQQENTPLSDRSILDGIYEYSEKNERGNGNIVSNTLPPPPPLPRTTDDDKK